VIWVLVIMWRCLFWHRHTVLCIKIYFCDFSEHCQTGAVCVLVLFKKGERGQGEGFSDYLNIDI